MTQASPNMSPSEIAVDARQDTKVDTETGPMSNEKLNIYDIQVLEVADTETQRQVHLGVEHRLTPEEEVKERKLLRKIDWHLMPLLMFTSGIQYADKITLSSAVAFDLRQGTHLVGNDFAWLSTGFYLSYLIVEIPFGWLMQRYPIEKVLGFSVLGWGICVFGLAACNNFTQLMAVRVLLGILESPSYAGFLIIITAWYKREEQFVRSMAFFAMISFFSLFILMINYAVGSAAVGSSIAPWRAIHLFLGALSFLWGCVLVWRLYVPKNAPWLNVEERVHAHARLVRNQAGESTSGIKFKWGQAWECARDPQMYFRVLYTLFQASASGGFSTFSTIILQSFGLNTEQTISYQLPWYGCQFIGMVGVAVIVSKNPTKNWNLIIAFTLLIPATLGLLLEALLSNAYIWGRLVGFWITGFYTPAAFIIWSSTGLNIGGRTKKSCGQAIIFVALCAGFCIGPQTFYASSAPAYRPGLYFCCACFGATEVVLAVWYVWVRWENKRRDRTAATMGLTLEQQNIEGCLFGLQDMTDMENPHFRYRY